MFCLSIPASAVVSLTRKQTLVKSCHLNIKTNSTVVLAHQLTHLSPLIQQHNKIYTAYQRYLAVKEYCVWIDL